MHRIAATAFFVTVSLALGGCDKFAAREHFHRANNYYQEEAYASALPEFQRGLELDPSATQVWRSVGFSALALYRPGIEDPENKQYAEIAVDAFRKYLSAYPEDQKVREYLESILMGSGRQDERSRCSWRMLRSTLGTPRSRAASSRPWPRPGCSSAPCNRRTPGVPGTPSSTTPSA